MERYLISFDDGAMNHIPEEDMAAVGEASRKVVREAKSAGVWIFGGGHTTTEEVRLPARSGVDVRR